MKLVILCFAEVAIRGVNGNKPVLIKHNFDRVSYDDGKTFMIEPSPESPWMKPDFTPINPNTNKVYIVGQEILNRPTNVGFNDRATAGA